MKTQKLLLNVGGACNALFFLFHLWLGWQFHRAQVAPGLRALLETLNAGGALLILFLAVASLAFARDVLGTALGRAVLALAAALYLLRAAAEFLVTPRLNPAIVAACLVVGLLYAAVLALGRATPPPAPAS